MGDRQATAGRISKPMVYSALEGSKYQIYGEKQKIKLSRGRDGVGCDFQEGRPPPHTEK